MSRLEVNKLSSTSLDPPKIFISYSHDSAAHMKRVLSLANRLRAEGVDCHIDQYELSPPEGWPRWTINQIELTDFVLIVCSEKYNLRFRGKYEKGKGLGAKWEGAIITQEIYESEADNTKFIPVLFSPDNFKDIPSVLRSSTYYDISTELGYEQLYRRITTQPHILKPSIGKLRPMPPRERLYDFHDDSTDMHSKDSSSKLTDSAEHSKDRSEQESRAHPHIRASWVFGFLLICFFVYVFKFAPDNLPEFKHRMIAFVCALIAGLFAAFMTGDIAVVLSSVRSRTEKNSVKAAGGFAAFVLVLIWWFSPVSPIKAIPKKVEMYTVRVTVLDPEQGITEDAEIRSSLGGELKKVSGGWEIDIPNVNIPMDGKLTVYASKHNPKLQGQVNLQLATERSLAAEVKLALVSPSSEQKPTAEALELSATAGAERPTNTSRTQSETGIENNRSSSSSNRSGQGEGRVTVYVTGRVVDDSSSLPIPEATVYIVGYDFEAVMTGQNGGFRVPAHAEAGKMIRVAASATGYVPKLGQLHTVGGAVTIRLRRQ